MARTYHYSGQTYRASSGTNPHSPKGHGQRLVILTAIILLLAVICASLGLIMESGRGANPETSGGYVQNTLHPTETSQQAATTPSQTTGGITDPPHSGDTTTGGSTVSDTLADTTSDIPAVSPIGFLKPFEDADTKKVSGIDGKYSIVIDAEDGRIIAGSKSDARMYPASMTKIMAVIVAYEYMLQHDVDINSTYVTMTREIMNYTIEQGASNAGFKIGEEVTIYDIFHGMILPSGADAVLMMAEYCAGGEAEFVSMMNAKLVELELMNTHFVTSTGLHDKNHYSTVYDMAVILDYACRYDFLRELLLKTHYTYQKTNLTSKPGTATSSIYRWRKSYNSNLSKSEVKGAVDFGGKSGYTPEAGYCLATFGIGGDGHMYIVVIGLSSNKKTVVSDYMKLYSEYIKFKAY